MSFDLPAVSDEPVTMFCASFSMTPPAPRPTLGQIRGVQEVIAQMPQLSIEPVHRFADGAYAREITLQAGDVIVGKQHRTRHFFFLMRGEITVWTHLDGKKVLKAPQVLITEPGTKRVIRAEQEAVIVTVHPTQETDLDKIESEIIVPETLALGGP